MPSESVEPKCTHSVTYLVRQVTRGGDFELNTSVGVFLLIPQSSHLSRLTSTMPSVYTNVPVHVGFSTGLRTG